MATYQRIAVLDVSATTSGTSFSVSSLATGGASRFLILSGVLTFADGRRAQFNAADNWRRWYAAADSFAKAGHVGAVLAAGGGAPVDDQIGLVPGNSYSLQYLVPEAVPYSLLDSITLTIITYA